MASIFAPPKKAAASSSTNGKDTDKGKGKKAESNGSGSAKGKAKADVEEEHESDEGRASTSKASQAAAGSDEDAGQISGVDGERNDEHDDSALESEEEGEQAAKMAEIFTKKVAGSSKGKWGKVTQVWKDGEP